MSSLGFTWSDSSHVNLIKLTELWNWFKKWVAEVIEKPDKY